MKTFSQSPIIPNFQNTCPLWLVFAASLSLLLTGCGKKEVSAAEDRKDAAPARTEPQPAAVPIAAAPQKTESQPVAALPVVTAVPDSSNDNRRMVAIFTANRADKSLNEKLDTFEDFVTSRITEKGFSVISREVVLDALSKLEKDSKQTETDKALGNNSSVLQVARNLGADYIFLVTISTYDTERQTTEAFDVKIVNVIHTLGATYKILDVVKGGTLAGDTFEESSTNRFTENYRSESTGIINRLLNKVSVKIAESAGKKVFAAAKPSNFVEFSVACGMQDLAGLPLSVPDVRLTKDNTVVVEKNPLAVQSLNVTVELDGVGMGSTPDTFKAAPGLHKIRLRREGFKDHEGTINIYQGQTFKIALQMTDAGYQRWKDNTAFLNSIENGKKLTDAEAEKLRGEAQKLRQSGNMVNIKVDTKVDTKEGPKIYKSIY